MIEKLHYITQGDSVEEQVQNALEACKAGVNWLQFRMKSRELSDVKAAGEEISKICSYYDVKFVVNDHVHLAKKLNAFGLHIGKNDMLPAEARKVIGSKMILGCTANTFQDIENVKDHADYIGLGPYRFTTTKKDLSPVLGLEGYKSILEQVSLLGIDLPIIAIGGIDTTDVAGLIKQGLYGIAVASLINNSTDKEMTVEQLNKELSYEYA